MQAKFVALRVRLTSSCWITELSEHEADCGEAEENEGDDRDYIARDFHVATSVAPQRGSRDMNHNRFMPIKNFRNGH